MSWAEPLLWEADDGEAEAAVPEPEGLTIMGVHQMLKGDASSIEVASTKALLKREASKSFFTCLRDEALHREEVEVLEYVIERLQYRSQQVGDADGEHRTLQIYRRIAVELDRVEGLAFNSMILLSNAIDQIDALQPLPSADITNELMSSMGETSEKEVPGYGKTLNEFGDAWFTHKLEEKSISELANFAEDSVIGNLLVHRDSAREFALEELNALMQRFGQYPLCRWFINIMVMSMTIRDNFTLFTYGWTFFPARHKPGLTALRWAAIGEELVAAVDTHCISYADVRSNHLFGLGELQAEVLPVLTLQLTHLKALMHSNTKKSADFKSAMLAGMVTVGITFGQLLVKHIL